MAFALDTLRARRNEVFTRSVARAKEAESYMRMAAEMEAAAQRLRDKVAELDRDIASLESQS